MSLQQCRWLQESPHASRSWPVASWRRSSLLNRVVRFGRSYIQYRQERPPGDEFGPSFGHLLNYYAIRADLLQVKQLGASFRLTRNCSVGTFWIGIRACHVLDQQPVAQPVV